MFFDKFVKQFSQVEALLLALVFVVMFFWGRFWMGMWLLLLAVFLVFIVALLLTHLTSVFLVLILFMHKHIMQLFQVFLHLLNLDFSFSLLSMFLLLNASFYNAP